MSVKLFTRLWNLNYSDFRVSTTRRQMGNISSQVFGGGDQGTTTGAMDRRNGGDDGGAGAASVIPDDLELKKNVEELVGQERIVIFSKESCPYCYDAKSVFDKMGQKYAVVELNQHPQGSNVQDILNDMTGARTVPRVFIDGKCIGGGSDTVQLFKNGQLEQMLSQDSLLESKGNH